MPTVSRLGPESPNVASNLSRFRRWAKMVGWNGGEMPVHKRTEITVETDRLLVIRRYRITRARCPACGSVVDMVDLADVYMPGGKNGWALVDHASAQGWHLAHAPDGSGLVCLDSLLKSM